MGFKLIVKCFSCKRGLNQGNSDSHEYKCTNCGISICEVCHYMFTEYREDPKEGESNCLGVNCPNCKQRLHFEEV